MIKIELLDVQGFVPAVHGMRNPKNSWNKSDSYETYIENPKTLNTAPFQFFLGDNDKKLMKNLSNAGVEHRTFARMVQVWVDIDAPLYWWKEMDRYCVGKTQISCSTMHKIHSKEFTLDDFSHEHILDYEMPKKDDCVIWNDCGDMLLTPTDIFANTIEMLNVARNKFLETKDKEYWWQMIQLLPSSYNQKRTVMMSYEVAMKILRERSNHKLDEWRTFCDWLKMNLPYLTTLTGEEE